MPTKSSKRAFSKRTAPPLAEVSGAERAPAMWATLRGLYGASLLRGTGSEALPVSVRDAALSAVYYHAHRPGLPFDTGYFPDRLPVSWKAPFARMTAREWAKYASYATGVSDPVWFSRQVLSAWERRRRAEHARNVWWLEQRSEMLTFRGWSPRPGWVFDGRWMQYTLPTLTGDDVRVCIRPGGLEHTYYISGQAQTFKLAEGLAKAAVVAETHAAMTAFTLERRYMHYYALVTETSGDDVVAGVTRAAEHRWVRERGLYTAV